MKSRSLERLGFLAAALCSISFIPQVWDIWNKRPAPATAISLPMYVILNTGVILWVIYGIGTKSRPVWVANLTILAFSLSILAYKLIYG